MEILMKALAQGTIPVIIHEGLFDKARPAFLPLSEVIDWNLATVTVSSWHVEVWRLCQNIWSITHMLYFQTVIKNLEEMHDGQILSMKKQGFNLYKKYFSSKEKLLDTLVAVLRQRLDIEPLEYEVVEKLILISTIDKINF